jgi:hypothetical protein
MGNGTIFIQWMASAMPGNTCSRKAVDMHYNQGLLFDKKWISNTIRVHVQFCAGAGRNEVTQI